MIGGLGWPEIILIFAVILLLFGAKRLPDVAKSLGRGIQEFKKASREIQSDIEKSVELPPEKMADKDKPADHHKKS
jgi:sec-independent protein translocase protein TatA